MNEKIIFENCAVVSTLPEGHSPSSLSIDIPKDTSDWLEDAFQMTAVRSSSFRLRCLVGQLFEEISTQIVVSSKSRQKQALKAILINLIHADQVNKPVRYSMNKNDYTSDRRYGKLFFKFDRLKPIIKALEDLGYIEKRPGFYNHETGEGRQTRMWGTAKLWEVCRKYRLAQNDTIITERFDDDEVIILHEEVEIEKKKPRKGKKKRKKKQKAVGYTETTDTRHMRAELERYNDFIDKYKINVKFDGSIKLDNRFLTEKLFRSIKDGKVWIEQVKFNSKSKWYEYVPPIQSFTRHRQLFSINPYKVFSKLKDNIQRNNTPQITNTKRGIALLRLCLRRYWSNEHLFQRDLENLRHEISRIPLEERGPVLEKEYTLENMGVDELVFVVEHNRLRRVFNKKPFEKISFEKGGRAYGAFHQVWLRDYMRKYIFIDDQPTVELDYSGFHIRMLYNAIGTDYRDECYVYAKADKAHEIERERIKTASLIVINAEDRKEAIHAVKKECRDNKIAYKVNEDEDDISRYEALVDLFHDFHEPIKDYFFSGEGLKLQYLDSKIMANILDRMMKQGIPALPVHDSVICPVRHKDFLRQVMIEEYVNVMGFEPVID